MPPKNQRNSSEEIDIYRTIEGNREPWFKLKKGDDVLMRSSVPGKPSNVARVEAIDTDSDGSNPIVLVRWFYRPEDTKGGRRAFHGTKEIFLSDHLGWESTDSIQGKCKVHSLARYTKLHSVGNDDFFSRFEYNIVTGWFSPDKVAVYCKCEMPRNPDEWMVKCVECKDWYHPSCLDTTIEEAKKLDHFRCKECSEQLQDLTSKTKAMRLTENQ